MTKLVTPSGATTSRLAQLKTVAAAVGGVLLLGAAGSGLWDLVFRPGLNRGSRLLLSIVTFGSTRIRDWAYESAAFDPTPLPALLLVLIVAVLPIGMLAARSLTSLLQRRESNIKIAAGSPALSRRERIAASRRAADLFRRKVGRLVLSLLCLFLLITLVALAVVNQSILIYRVFHADLAICTPYISEQERKELLAAFALVKTRADYSQIQQKLQAIASRAGVNLREEALW